MELFALTETAETVSKDCLQWLWRHKSKLLPVWTFVNTIHFVTMRLPFNATCGDVASWRNDQTDWKQAFAKLINFSSLKHLAGHKKNLGGTAPVATGLGRLRASLWVWKLAIVGSCWTHNFAQPLMVSIVDSLHLIAIFKQYVLAFRRPRQLPFYCERLIHVIAVYDLTTATRNQTNVLDLKAEWHIHYSDLYRYW